MHSRLGQLGFANFHTFLIFSNPDNAPGKLLFIVRQYDSFRWIQAIGNWQRTWHWFSERVRSGFLYFSFEMALTGWKKATREWRASILILDRCFRNTNDVWRWSVWNVLVSCFLSWFLLQITIEYIIPMQLSDIDCRILYIFFQSSVHFACLSLKAFVRYWCAHPSPSYTWCHDINKWQWEEYTNDIRIDSFWPKFFSDARLLVSSERHHILKWVVAIHLDI